MPDDRAAGDRAAGDGPADVGLAPANQTERPPGVVDLHGTDDPNLGEIVVSEDEIRERIADLGAALQLTMLVGRHCSWAC